MRASMNARVETHTTLEAFFDELLKEALVAERVRAVGLRLRLPPSALE